MEFFFLSVESLVLDIRSEFSIFSSKKKKTYNKTNHLLQSSRHNNLVSLGVVMEVYLKVHENGITWLLKLWEKRLVVWMFIIWDISQLMREIFMLENEWESNKIEVVIHLSPQKVNGRLIEMFIILRIL